MPASTRSAARRKAVLDAAIEASGATANAGGDRRGRRGQPTSSVIVAQGLARSCTRLEIVNSTWTRTASARIGTLDPGVDLGAAILAAKESGLLVAGGGHAMAAGLNGLRVQLMRLALFLNERLAADVEQRSGDRSLLIDVRLLARDQSLVVRSDRERSLRRFGLRRASPPGRRTAQSGAVGTDHLRLIVAGDDGARFKAIAFRKRFSSGTSRAAVQRAAAPASCSRAARKARRLQPPRRRTPSRGCRPGRMKQRGAIFLRTRRHHGLTAPTGPSKAPLHRTTAPSSSGLGRRPFDGAFIVVRVP